MDPHQGTLQGAGRLPGLQPALMPYFKSVHGVTVPAFFPDDAVASALSYEPKEGDVFIVTYAKCGTTWTQYIAHCIIHNGEPPSNITEFLTRSPFIELFGADAVNTTPRPDTIKTHLACGKLKYSPHAKYIYVARNPSDVCVSTYYHMRSLSVSEEYLADFDEFVKGFASRAGNGCYLEDTLIPWYARRCDSNVLFLTYEQLHSDTKEQVKRLAEFLGQEYGRRVSTDPALLQRIVDLSTKERMRPFLKDYAKELIEAVANYRMSRNLNLAPELRNLLDYVRHRPRKQEFLREGSVGGYANVLSEDNRKVLKAWITAKTSGSDVMRLWPHIEV